MLQVRRPLCHQITSRSLQTFSCSLFCLHLSYYLNSTAVVRISPPTIGRCGVSAGRVCGGVGVGVVVTSRSTEGDKVGVRAVARRVGRWEVSYYYHEMILINIATVCSKNVFRKTAGERGRGQKEEEEKKGQSRRSS